MGSILLDQAEIGEGAFIGAGSLVPQGKVIPQTRSPLAVRQK